MTDYERISTREYFLGIHQGSHKYVEPGTSRTVKLQETRRRANQILSTAGISRIADITGLDIIDVPVYLSIRPDADEGNLTVTSGKGTSAEAAEVSAIMEGVERHFGERRGRTGVVTTLGRLRGRGVRAIDPRRLVVDTRNRYSPSQTDLEWWPLTELNTGVEVYAPAELVFVPYHGNTRLFGSSSNGLASGNTPVEATLHAVLEVIERDAVAFGEVLLDGASVDIATLDGQSKRLLGKISAAGIEVHIRYFETEFAVPTFHVILDDRRSNDSLLINGGFGTSLSPSIALTRAITEAVQSRLNVISGAREDVEEPLASRLAGYDHIREKLARWLTDWRTIKFQEIRDQSTGFANQDLDVLRSRLYHHGCKVLFACELAPDGYPFSVVRVVVPGLEMAHIQRHRVGPRLRSGLQDKGLLPADGGGVR